MFCRHNWEKVNQFETNSVVEIVAKVQGANFNSKAGDIYNKKYITDYTCTKCGKLKRFIVNN